MDIQILTLTFTLEITRGLCTTNERNSLLITP